MPSGLGYPLVPGYEAVGTVRQAGSECNLKPGQRVFVPGASCYKGDVRGLFGGSASVLVAPEARVVDVSGAGGQNFNRLIKRLAKGGRLTLGGFYKEPVQFDFAPAFMREATLGIAAEWVRDDLAMTLALVQAGALSLDGLVTHQYTCDRAAEKQSKSLMRFLLAKSRKKPRSSRFMARAGLARVLHWPICLT